jgi:EmrB/QacA subfamily drug resistance transporter
VSGRHNPWLVLVALVPGMFLALADATVMTIAIPEIIQRLESSVTEVSWILNGYNLVLTVLFMTMGRLADRFGHKGLFLIGLLVFTAASLGCALSPTVPWIIAFRTLQAAGAAAVIPTSLTMLLDAFPIERQGLAAGLFGAITSLSASLGPTLGGLLIRAAGWEWIFFFNLPVGLLGVALVAWLAPRRPREPGISMDWPGVVLISGGLFCLTMGLMEGNNWGWLSGGIIGLFAGAAAALALFVWWELRTPAPLFDLRLFKRRAFAAATAGMTTVDIAMMGTAFMLVIYLVALGDYTELMAAGPSRSYRPPD